MDEIVRLIMQIVRVPREIAEIILGYIPVRRRLTVTPDVEFPARWPITWPITGAYGP